MQKLRQGACKSPKTNNVDVSKKTHVLVINILQAICIGEILCSFIEKE